jgi:hypothetical protein
MDLPQIHFLLRVVFLVPFSQFPLHIRNIDIRSQNLPQPDLLLHVVRHVLVVEVLQIKVLELLYPGFDLKVRS